MVAKAAKTTEDQKSNALAVQDFSLAELASIQSFEDAAALLATRYETILDSDDLGDGFDLVKDKSTLLDQTMLLISWRIMDADDKMKFGEPWVIVRAVTEDNRKIVFIDGSTGIRDQLVGVTASSGRTGGVLARDGLRVSVYDYTDDKGVTTEAKTYYIA
ncbi:hypothetical protein [Rhodococcus phage P19]|nr:hypothetical protein [Rhodococcus phage P19]